MNLQAATTMHAQANQATVPHVLALDDDPTIRELIRGVL